MRRAGLVVAALLVLAVLASTGLSSAAFVDSTQTDASAGADTVTRWLGLEAPSGASCTAGPDVAVGGSDQTAAVAVGGREAGTAAGRTLDCSLVLRARDTLPDGATSFRVEARPDALGGQPLAEAAITGLDGSGAADEVTLAPGERRAVRLTVRDSAAARGALLLVVHVGAEQTDFLRYAVPVEVCEGALAASCVTPADPPPPPDDGGGTTTPGGGQTPVTPPVGGSAPSTAPGAKPVTPGATPRRPVSCTSRRSITIRLPKVRGQRVRSARVTVKGRRVRVRRRGGRFSATVELRRYPAQTVRVSIVQRTASGRSVRSTRTFRTCAAKKAKPKTTKPKTRKKTS